MESTAVLAIQETLQTFLNLHILFMNYNFPWKSWVFLWNWISFFYLKVEKNVHALWLDPFFNMAGKLLIKMVKENRQEAAKSEDKWENWTPEAIAFSV